MHNPNGRLEAFCDGVFAVALTLLIIEIKVPDLEDGSTKTALWHAFLHGWPEWLAFFISFITILICWVNHNHMFKLIDKSSVRFTYANGLLLMAIIVLPFSTAAVARYINTGLAQPAITVYAAVCLVNNIAWVILSELMFRPVCLLKDTIDVEKVRKNRFFNYYGTILYAILFILSFWLPITSFVLIGLTFVLWLILGIAIKAEKLEKEGVIESL